MNPKRAASAWTTVVSNESVDHRSFEAALSEVVAGIRAGWVPDLPQGDDLAVRRAGYFFDLVRAWADLPAVIAVGVDRRVSEAESRVDLSRSDVGPFFHDARPSGTDAVARRWGLTSGGLVPRTRQILQVGSA